MIEEFKLPKSGETASIEILNPGHLGQVLELMEATRASLPEEQKRFVLPQKPEYFQKFLNHENGVMIGIMASRKLIAQMVVMGPIPLEQAISTQSITRNKVTFHHAVASDIVTIAKSMAVHPEKRGNELSQSLLEAALKLPFVRAADHMFAQISSENMRSWELFLKQHFGIVAAINDPIDNQPRFIVQKPALGFALHPEASAYDIRPMKDFKAIGRMTEREALVGILDTSEKDLSLVFHAGTDTAMAWSEDEQREAV